MRTIKSNSVRRQLFAPSEDDQARIDNTANILLELTTKDVKEKSMKWCFDFKNEVALDGDWVWAKKSGDEWIGMKPERDTVIEDDKFKPIQFNNENTPKPVRVDTAPINKRKRHASDCRAGTQAVKKRLDLSFKCSLIRHEDD